ncbi:MAG TPA: FliA/WhiG family RNA polymerase sigma factor [Bryobacteraceae bacterium]|nr:FliA/WhiG family RNA polymerase sigma factor [Bryobacteraceae bacterium]
MPVSTPAPNPVSEISLPEVGQSTRDELVLKYLPLVRAIAIRVYENLPVHVDVDDLVHAGVMGLFDAATKYDADKQVSFQGYAKHRIKGAILDSLRDMDWASRDLRKRHKQLEAVTRELTAALERPPTEAEIAEKMGMDITRWRQVAIELRMVGVLSASTRAPESENESAPEYPATDQLNPDVLTGKRELRNVLSTAMKTLPERYQAVIGLYYLGGKTMREIGDRLGINESRVSQIHKAALDKMGVSLQAAGIHSSECLL